MRCNAMQLFNSLSQQIETFVARNDEVKLYVCGITPYDTAHLGHAFVFATFDILVRYLRSQGLRVVYVENVTDIDDPLFERALELGNISWDQLAQQETERFVREMHAIHVVMPDHFVRASEQLSTCSRSLRGFCKAAMPISMMDGCISTCGAMRSLRNWRLPAG